MTDALHRWLQEIWKHHNHPKYQKYFEEWVKNLTPAQIDGFTRQEQHRNIYESR
jgi:hypothetical protein